MNSAFVKLNKTKKSSQNNLLIINDSITGSTNLIYGSCVELQWNFV